MRAAGLVQRRGNVVNSAWAHFCWHFWRRCASIVELEVHGTPDLVGDQLGKYGYRPPNEDAIYVTAQDGVIRNVSLPLSSRHVLAVCEYRICRPLYGIKDVPANALGGFCPGSVPCPTGESVLAVATGFIDPDALERGGTSNDAINICTNQADANPVSCALLLNTSSNPGLTSTLGMGQASLPRS